MAEIVWLKKQGINIQVLKIDESLAGKVFQKTPCFAWVSEDQGMNRPDKNFVEFDEVLHGHISSVAESSFDDGKISRVELFRIMRKDLLHTGKMSVLDDQILEIMSRDPLPSIREAAKRKPGLDSGKSDV